MLSFYFAPGTSSMAPHIALHEIGVPFESCPLSFAQGEQRQSSYLALNTEGKVPTLMVNGRPLTEVAAILYYLARTYPAADLMPANDTEAEAQVISWMSFMLPLSIRRVSEVPNIQSLSTRLPMSDWATQNGQWAATRLRISICFDCIGVCAMHSTSRRDSFRIWPRTMIA